MRQSSRRPTIPQDQLGRMASAAMEWSISPQEKKFQKYIQTFLPYYMKNGDPNPVQSLKRDFMKDDCSKGKACQDLDCLFLHQGTSQQIKQRKKRAFQKYVDEKLDLSLFPYPTVEDMKQLLKFGKDTLELETLEDFMRNLKKERCTKTNKTDPIDNSCFYRHPLESDLRISQIKALITKHLQKQQQKQQQKITQNFPDPTEEDFENLFKIGYSIRTNKNFADIVKHLKEEPCTISHQHLRDVNACYDRHTIEKKDRIQKMKRRFQTYLERLIEQKPDQMFKMLFQLRRYDDRRFHL
jgi:hypothetical protein